MPISIPASDEPRARAQFTQTRWSLVLAAGNRREGDSHAALAWLCERYWFPLFAHVRGRGQSAEDAEDSVQAFFEHLLTQKVIGRAEAERGRFRSFLLGCLNHFLAHEWIRGQRLKRGGGAAFISLHEHDAEARLQRELADRRSPALDYDRAWALTLLDRVFARLRSECEDDGNSGRFEVLQNFLQGERGELPLAQAAATLALPLPALKSLVHRLRQRFREMIREEVRETVSAEADVPAELQHLFAALGR